MVSLKKQILILFSLSFIGGYILFGLRLLLRSSTTFDNPKNVNNTFGIISTDSVTTLWNYQLNNASHFFSTSWNIFDGNDVERLRSNSPHKDKFSNYDIYTLSQPKIGKKYAVFGASTPFAFPAKAASYGYHFYLPLTTLAWKRVGFESVVVIAGSLLSWTSNTLLLYILQCLKAQGAIVVFVNCTSENSVMLSQVARLFSCNFFSFRGIEDTYLLLSDADLWPLDGETYNLPLGKDILSLNSDCCGSFDHRGRQFKFLPACNIGMKVNSWRRVLNSKGRVPRTAPEIVDYFADEFGSVARRPVEKGENLGWYLDQRMLSVRIQEWSKETANGPSKILYVPRDPGRDRVDRSWWAESFRSEQRKIDAHVFERGYESRDWARLSALLSRMYGGDSKQYKWCQEYREEFMQHLGKVL